MTARLPKSKNSSAIFISFANYLQRVLYKRLTCIILLSTFFIYSFLIIPAVSASSSWPMFGHDQFHSSRSQYIGSPGAFFKWHISISSTAYSSPVIGDDGTVYLGSTDGNFHAFTPNGTVKWSYDTGDKILQSAAIDSDGTIYVVSEDKKIYAFYPDGLIKWWQAIGLNVYTAPTIANNTIYLGSADGRIYALKPNGTVEWTYDGGTTIITSPAIDFSGNIYFGDNNKNIYSLDSFGNFRWKLHLSGFVSCPPSIDSTGIIYIAVASSNKIYAINPDGTSKWTYNTPQPVCSPIAIGNNDIIYFGCDDNNLYAVGPDGTFRWNYPASGRIKTSPTVDSEESIYFCTDGGILYVLNSDSSLKWKYNATSEICSSPVIAENGTIYFTTLDSRLYSLGPDGIDITDDTTAPLPASNFNAEPLLGGKIKLTWYNSTSADVKIYNIYWDNGTGTINYDTPLIRVEHPDTSLVTSVLSYGTNYKFAIRIQDFAGNEEKNDYIASVKTYSPGSTEANIIVPQHGQKIYGNAVSVIAELNSSAGKVEFQYKKPEDMDWSTIAFDNNIIPGYGIYWDTENFGQGDYHVRAVAYDTSGNPDFYPESITVTIDEIDADILEMKNHQSEVIHYKIEKVTPDNNKEILIADGTKIYVPSGNIDDTKKFKLSVLNPGGLNLPLPPVESAIQPTGIYRKCEFIDDEKTFKQKLLLCIPYSDKNKDNIVDGTDFSVDKLKVFVFSQDTNLWEEVKMSPDIQTSSLVKKLSTEDNIIAEVAQANIYAVFGMKTIDSLDDVIVYPNPYKPNSALGHDKIIFDGLPVKSKVRIYTLRGKLLRELSNETDAGQILWDACDNSGEKLISDIYLYIATAENMSSTKKGKLAIIR